MERDQELKNIDDNQLNEADMVVDDENNFVDTEIQKVDGLIVDLNEEENLVAATGFEVKKWHTKKTKSGLVRSKYIMCNREGVPKDININTLDFENNDKQVRNRRHRITGCKARIKVDLHSVSRKYDITKFVSKHNHQMIPKHYKHLTNKQRKMTQAEKMFVVKASTMKLGATRAHNLCSSIKGGAQYVHGTSDDFKNHIMDVNAFIGKSDAQMLINKMENRKKFVPNFTFQYKVENSELVAMFWADEVDKCNYKEFGDISFDATFRTNNYDMVFVPFTGIDNHRKCVTVGSGLLLREDTEAYTWLLRSFMTAYEKQATIIVTDQDGAMKLAIKGVLTESKHRLCMWHIMKNITAKICIEIYDETGFKERFNKIVWNMFMEPMEFEEKRSKLIEDFGLQNHKRMTKMFNLREMWLPAYFIDSPLFGLMRTTSRSEIESAFFKSFINHGSTLVNFMMCFESAMERQRKYILRYWRRDIIPPALRRNKNRYGEKNETIKKLTNEANYVKTGDVIEDKYAVEKPQQHDVNNLQRARNKGGRRGERRKSGREIALKAKTKQIRKCLRCGEKTNNHTKSTCPSNPKYVTKLARLVVVAVVEQ
uniref:Uncharacterized protein n=2 Tax=Tanacetum cinerariifolium TaxID=118510 RepID=A0A6L2L8J5_TANCI|nr:hypothetical protein [Tanacetum cinerariifolium]